MLGTSPGMTREVCSITAPALQRPAPQGLPAALRPGHGASHVEEHRRAVAVEYPARDANPFARGIRGHEIIGEGVIPGVFAARRQPVFEKRTDGLRRRNPLSRFFYSFLHYLVSIGVALRPRSTMLK